MSLNNKTNESISAALPKIAVLFGGCSPEYEVSLQSAHAVISSIDRRKYTPMPIGITRGGDWYLFKGDIGRIISDTWYNPAYCTPVAVLPGRHEHALLCLSNDTAEKIHIDAAFPILHGRNGEDGTVQGIFELADIPVIGCGVLSSALCMDKDRAHKLVMAADIAVPKSFVVEKDTAPQAVLSAAEETGYPLFVKPVRAGSSFGITKVPDSGALPGAVKLAFEYDSRVIIEECIDGVEVGCAIMGNENPVIGEVDEIELSGGFFDFDEKYSLKTSAIHVPARISVQQRRQIQLTAQKIYKALDCRGFARVDMFLSAAGEILFNEVNTIPGFTAHSRFPSMLKAAGLTFEQITDTLIGQALAARTGSRQCDGR